MTPRHEQIVELIAQGYSVPAVACRLGTSENSIRLILSRLRISAVVVPPGFVTIPEAARRVRMPAYRLYAGIRQGDLRRVRSGSRLYTKMEWVSIWRDNDPYRVKAREMMRLLLAHKDKQGALGAISPKRSGPRGICQGSSR
jgi:hypothetical protein